MNFAIILFVTTIMIIASYYVIWLCDYSILIPYMIFITYYLSSLDIIHSFGLWCIGIRVDCIPGKINCIYEIIKVNGKMKGLCYELCGQYHSNMFILGFSLVFKIRLVNFAII